MAELDTYLILAAIKAAIGVVARLVLIVPHKAPEERHGEREHSVLVETIKG